MYRIILIFFIITFIAIFGIQLKDAHSLSLSSTVTHFANNTATSLPYTNFFLHSKDYQHCLENTHSCSPIINIIYESPTTVILQSHLMNPLWKAVDKVKKSGFDISGVTYIPESNSNDVDNSFDLLVVLSQNSLQSHHK
ncbi:MAG TPA: hypothetical protein VN704_11865 [Verrucomicrobiae bacterium]|nr:hypothetical protein [Verrucomicrobiae bacterium]